MTLTSWAPRLVLAVFLAGAGIGLTQEPTYGFLLGLEESPRFQQISIEQGLSNDRINHVFQDSRGFLWIGTTDGLNRYDGHEVRIYRHDPNDGNTIAANWIAGMSEDAHGNLWILFGIGGIDRFDPDRETFVHYRHDPEDPASLPFDELTSSHLMDDGSLWFGSNGWGWIELRTSETSAGFDFEFRRVPFPAAPWDAATLHPPNAGREADSANGRRPSIREAGFTTDWLDSNGTWVGTAGGLFHRDRSGDPIRWIDSRSVTALGGSASDLVWVGRGDGTVELLDPRNQEIQAHVSLPSVKSRSVVGPTGTTASPNSSSAVLLVEDVRGQLWILQMSGRLFRYNPSVGILHEVPVAARVLDLRADERGAIALATSDGFGIYDPVRDRVTIHPIERDTPMRGALAPRGQEAVSRLFEDRSGGLWVATWGTGLQRWNERATHFQHVPLDQVRCMSRTEDGAVWIGTAAGLYRDSLGGGSMSPQPEQVFPRTGRASIAALAPSRTGGLWTATDLALFHLPADGSPRLIWEHVAPIHALVEDGQGRLWIGTNDSLWRLDPGASSPVRFPTSTSPRNDSMLGPRVHTLAAGADGALWIGTYVGGLSRLDTESGLVEHFVFDPNDPSSLNNLSVNHVLRDHRGRVWVGTYSGGLDLYESGPGGFRHYTEREGLAGNQVLSILEDDMGKLWIATNQGLSRLDPESNEFRNFDWSDGLLSQPFEKGACLRDGDGRMVFGGRNGITRFDPSKIETRTTPPPVALTALRIEDAKVPLSEHQGTDSDISLAPQEDFVSFEFVGLEFGSPTRVRYSYRLDGFDDSWVVCGRRSYAAYTNLDPGQYEFLARATLDGVTWSEPLSITLEVRPPFYRTAWFFGAVTLGILALLLGIHRVRVHQQVRRSLLEERIRVAERERVREQVARDYHDEMGHKLTKLGIFSELIQRSAGRIDPTPERGQLLDYADKIEDTVQSLVRDTRDFLWTLDPRRDSVYELALYMQEFGRRLFADTEIRFRVEGMEETLRSSRLSADWKRQLSLILKEALTNSLRHSEAQEVALRFGVVDDELEILATDDGRGFQPEEVGLRATGGHGLANMRRRAEAIGGKLLLDSGSEHGTRLRFTARAG